MIGALCACTTHTVHTFGQINDLAPKVAATRGERLPLHVTVQLGRPANVAVFLVVPGRGSTLLFPEDSTQSGYMEAGTHLVETSFAKTQLADSSRLLRRPQTTNGNIGNRGTMGGGRNGVGGRGDVNDNGVLGAMQHGFLMVYASQEPLSYSTLAARVSGLSIPAYDDDALNTVTKLIRESTHTVGPWAAYATDFPP
ncbi:MAG TPA: hypothetical protein VHV78_11910 [Gemmatimonadaceae bacterium]|nr:hypothetical protein [Gemmatimonadaceae bacterium]